MKIWDKGFSLDKKIENFTVGNDRTSDLKLVEFDLLASLAHAEMLRRAGIIKPDEQKRIASALNKMLTDAQKGIFKMDDDVEDVHSQIEKILIEKLGDTGKKIHTARSRNDQVFTAILLCSKHNIKLTANLIKVFFSKLMMQAKRYQHTLLPGYTHTQVAMPSSFGLWFSGYAESLIFDIEILTGAFHAINQNPLGSAAGYGSSFPIRRKMTTQKLNFDDLMYASTLPQMLRGKAEWAVVSALGSVALTLNKLASDICLFNCQNFNFLILPKEFTTGSSIMPHKKNPDVFELIRAKTNAIMARQNELALIISNLMSGYHRDFQQTKEIYLKTWEELTSCLEMMIYALEKLQVNKNILNDKKYDMMFSLENVAELVKSGKSFRDAYQQIGKEIEENRFNPIKTLHHTHEGSIHQLCLEQIHAKFQKTFSRMK